MKKILIIIGIILLLLILAVIGIAGYATGTQKGFSQVLSLAQKYSPGELNWDSAKGKLLGPLDLQNLTYQQEDGLQIELAVAKFDWEPKQLLSKRLRINTLNATDIEIHLPPPKEDEPDEPFSLPDIRLPVDLDIRELDLKNIKVYPYEAEKPIVIERLNLTAAAEGATVQVLDFKLKSPEADASITGTLQPSDNYPMDINLDWVYRHAEFGEFNGSGKINGDLAKLHIDHQLKGAANAVINADILNAMEDLSWDADIDLDAKDPQVFSEQLNPIPMKAVFHSTGNLDAFNADGNLNASLQATGSVKLDFKLQGNTQKLQFEKLLVKLVDHPGEILLHGNIELEPLQADLQGNWKQLGWPLTTEAEYISEQGNFKFSGSPEKFQAQLSTAVDGTQLIPLTAAINVTGTDKAIQIKSLTLNANNSDLELTAKGEFNIEQQSFDLDGDWQSMSWPMQGDAQFESPKGAFKAAGKVTDYQFELSTALLGKDIPKGSWQLSGHGSDKALSKFELSGETLEGKIQSNGTAAWNPQVIWDVELAAQDINPGEQWPQAKGKIDLKLTSKGELTDNGPQLTANIAKLSGNLRGQPIAGSGQVNLEGKNIDLKNLQISSGDARLKLDGKLSDKWDVKWDINAKDLAQLAPDFKGSISGKGSLQGTAEQPHAKFKIQVNNLAGAGIKIKQLKGDGNIDISGKKSSVIKLRGKALLLGGETWKDFSVDGSGKPEKHTLKLALNGKLAEVKTALSGGLKDQTWRGTLSDLSAKKTEFGDWLLAKPAKIEANKSTAKADALCLTSKPTQLCITGSWDAKTGSKGEIELSELKPERFKKYLPPGLTLLTELNGKVVASVDANGEIKSDAKLRFTPGQIKIESDDEPIVIELQEGTINAKVKDNNINSTVLMNLDKVGEVSATVAITDFKKAQKLSGNIKSRLSDLSPVSGFAPDLQAVTGNLNADISLSGTIKAPLFSGQLAIKDFSTEIPQLATTMTAPEIKISSDGKGQIRLAGLAKSGNGELKLTGEFDPQSKALKIKVKGESFEVARSKALKAVISPDLVIQMDSDGMLVKGEVLIPKAHINAKGASSEEGVISVSGDVILIENGEITESKSAASNMTLDVKITLGDDIKVEVADFSGELRGSLRVQQTPELAPLGTGMIEVVNGDYLVYGQQLKMERGRVLFGGGPVDNPQLDMNVARRVEAYQVTAGAYIRGTAQAPQLTLYSDPPMPDASILSYMILGQPPGTKGGSYTLGKYLTPDLYVGYSIGLFNAINTFNLRYKLTEKLGLHAASGIANSADLIYTIER